MLHVHIHVRESVITSSGMHTTFGNYYYSLGGSGIDHATAHIPGAFLQMIVVEKDTEHDFCMILS